MRGLSIECVCVCVRACWMWISRMCAQFQFMRWSTSTYENSMTFIRLLCTQAQAHARTPNAQFIGVFCVPSPVFGWRSAHGASRAKHNARWKRKRETFFAHQLMAFDWVTFINKLTSTMVYWLWHFVVVVVAIVACLFAATDIWQKTRAHIRGNWHFRNCASTRGVHFPPAQGLHTHTHTHTTGLHCHYSHEWYCVESWPIHTLYSHELRCLATNIRC